MDSPIRDEMEMKHLWRVSYCVKECLALGFASVLLTFRNRVKNAVTSKGIGVGIECK
jgi:hypothetical protein